MAKTSTAVKNRWNKKNYDSFYVRVKKGEKQIITDHAASKGLSLNGYINQLITNDMEGIKMTRTTYKGYIIDTDNLGMVYIYNASSPYSEDSDKKVLGHPIKFPLAECKKIIDNL